MRIGINGAFLRRPGVGVGQVSEQVLRHLPTDKCHEYIVYTEEIFQGHHSWLSRSDIRVKPMLPRWRRDDLIRKILWERFILPRAVKDDGCDAFISLYQSPTIMPKSIRHTMVVHDIIPKLFPGYLNNMRKRLVWRLTEEAIRRATNIVTVSEWSCRDVMEQVPGVDPGRIKSSSIAVSDVFRVFPGEKEKQATLEHYGLERGYMYHGGGFEVRKNTETLLQAYVLLKQRYASENRLQELPRLVLSGRPRPQLAPLVIDISLRVHELELDQNVKLLGFVPQEDLPALYSGASMFVYPSLYEGFGMPVLEAMCQRVAVVCSRASSLPEVGGDAVRYFDPTKPEDLADQITYLLDHPEEREALAARGWQRSQQFSWRTFVRDLFATFL